MLPRLVADWTFGPSHSSRPTKVLARATAGWVLALGFSGISAVAAEPATPARPATSDVVMLAPLTVKGAIEMPPFVVSERTGNKWRFAETEGFEIISQCGDETSQQVFAALWRGQRIALPPELQPRNAMPMAVVLFDQEAEKTGGIGSMGSSQARHEMTSHWTNVIKRTLPDREIFSINLYQSRPFTYSSTFRFDLRTHLTLGTPAVMPWVIEALNGEYGIHREGIRYQEGDKFSEIVQGIWDRPDELKEAVAVKRVVTSLKRFGTERRLRRDELAGPSPLMDLIPPIAGLWAGGLGPDNTTPRQRNRWAANCALFARWGIYAEEGKYRDGFWRFVTESRSRPITEEFFRQCFGLGYEDARDELAWYLPLALAMEERRPIARLDAPRLKFRPATVSEIGRVRGEFARGESLVLAERFPEVAEQYRQQAWRTLDAGLKDNPADTRIAATLGLLEYEQGHTTRARELLEQATAVGWARPQAWLALAQIRFIEASTTVGPKGMLNAEQTSAVLIPLTAALQVAPASAGSYELLAELWRRSRELSAGEMLARFEEGQKAFPRNPRLAFTLLRAAIERGQREGAIAIIDRALPLVADADTKDRLTKTRGALTDSLAAKPAAK